jgi:SAM-dependent methyltransferase
MNFRERILSEPLVYRTFKRIVLPAGAQERVVNEHFVAPAGGKVLDLGCGFGDLAPFFSGRCEYLGIDHNESYIDKAREMNAGSPARFVVADVADPLVGDSGPFDLIMMSGVLHHLDSHAIRELAQLISALLAPGGRFVAVEPVFDPNQGLTARLTIAADRGRFVRDEDGYRTLLHDAFSTVEIAIVSGLLRIPYTHAIITSRNAERA